MWQSTQVEISDWGVPQPTVASKGKRLKRRKRSNLMMKRTAFAWSSGGRIRGEPPGQDSKKAGRCPAKGACRPAAIKFQSMLVSDLQIIFLLFLQENNLRKALISFIGVRKLPAMT
jgi:hypothetical protein